MGGGGFIGSAVTDQLLAENWIVRVFERPGVFPHRNFGAQERVEWVEGTFGDLASVRRALRGVNAVVHLISTMLPRQSNEAPYEDVQSNVLGSVQLMQEMVLQGVERIVFASSGGTVYGVPIKLPIREDHPTEPQVSYGICKLMIEKYLGLFSQLHGLRPLSLRIANPYGGRQRIDTAQGAVAVFLHRALQRQPVEIWGDGSVVRDYLHVTDVAAAISAALRYEGQHQVMNIGAGRGLSLNGLLDEIGILLNRKIDRRYLPGRSFDVPVSVLDISLAITELSWTPRISLSDGLRFTLAGRKQ
jgi:UDP-glucose 4-epimerase